MYVIPDATAFPRITLVVSFLKNQSWTKGKINRKSRRNITGKDIALLNHFGIYKLSIYKNS